MLSTPAEAFLPNRVPWGRAALRCAPGPAGPGWIARGGRTPRRPPPWPPWARPRRGGDGADAADEQRGVLVGGTGAVVEGRHLLDDGADVVAVVALQLLALHHGDGHRHVLQAGFAAGGGDGHRLQRGRGLLAVGGAVGVRSAAPAALPALPGGCRWPAGCGARRGRCGPRGAAGLLWMLMLVSLPCGDQTCLLLGRLLVGCRGLVSLVRVAAKGRQPCFVSANIASIRATPIDRQIIKNYFYMPTRMVNP